MQPMDIGRLIADHDFKSRSGALMPARRANPGEPGPGGFGGLSFLGLTPQASIKVPLRGWRAW